MNKLSLEQFNELMAQAQVKPRLLRELRFMASTQGMAPGDWPQTELLSIGSRSINSGVLLLAPGDDIFVLPYKILRGLVKGNTGLAQPIICDFCRTWQAGSGAGSISLQKDKRSLNSVGFLCCADLACSKHVRNKTAAASVSRAQLHEDLTSQQRAQRLKNRLHKIITNLGLEPVTLRS